MTSVAVESQQLAPTVWQLARVEGRRLLRHPVVLVALVLSAAWTFTFARADVGGDYFAVAGPGLLPLLAALVAANLATLRSRRSDTEELYESLPSPARTRTLAHLVSVGWLFAGSAVFVAAAFVGLGGLDGFVVDFDGTTAVPSVAELAHGPLAVATVAALGIALARWIPFLPAGPVLATGLVVLQMPMTTWNVQNAGAWFLPLVNAADTPPGTSFPCERSAVADGWCGEPVFQTTAAGWHLAYLAGLVIAFGGVALLRHDRRPRTIAVGVAGLAVAAVAGALQIS